MDHLLHADHRPHPAGLLLLHRAAAGGRGAGGEEHDAAAGEQDQAAAEHAAGKNSLPVMDDRLLIIGGEKRKEQKKKALLIEGTTLISQYFSVQFTDISEGVVLPRCTSTLCCYVLWPAPLCIAHKALYSTVLVFLCNLYI